MNQTVTFPEEYLHILIDLCESNHLCDNLRFRSPKLSSDFSYFNAVKFDPFFTLSKSAEIAKGHKLFPYKSVSILLILSPISNSVCHF